jgi:hypothetical protein
MTDAERFDGPFDAAEIAAADRLDVEITATLAGRPSTAVEPSVLWLASALRAEPSSALAKRVATVAAVPRQPWRTVRVAAVVLAVLLAAQGFGNLIAGPWIAAHIHQPYTSHGYFEGGFALIALGLAVAVGALRRRTLPVSVVAGSPLGILFALHGTGELGVFALGAALHMAQGAAAVFLLLIWLRARRYGSPDKPEDST